MIDTWLGLSLVTSAFVLVSWRRKYLDSRSHPPLPPGPRSLPVLGSVLSLDDPFRPWRSFNAWKHIYGGHNIGGNMLVISHCSAGDLVYARLLRKRVVVVNSEEVAKDLFELRSMIYSDKPQSIVLEP